LLSQSQNKTWMPTEFELSVPENAATVSKQVEELAARLGLECLVLNLARYPGCRHFHLRKVGEKGTLECTWWPSAGRLWLSRRSNREGVWIDDAVRAFQDEFS
jgi:hypothetical protein